MRELNRLVLNITNGTRAAHAFIVEGQAGEARDSFVTSLAQGLECTSSDVTLRPCGTCPSCRQIAAGTGLDVVRMSKSQGSGRTARATYKVDDASGFIERLGMGAYGRFLIGIIDDADSLSEVVQNKLLKTLEEPGPGTILILSVSNRDNLLSTVRSRCSEIRLSDYVSDDGEEAERIQVLTDLANKLTDPECKYYVFRAAADKNVKSREEALMLLDILDDDMRTRMRTASGVLASELQNEAAIIELSASARMDIRREMTYSKTLKRLFLQLRDFRVR